MPVTDTTEVGGRPGRCWADWLPTASSSARSLVFHHRSLACLDKPRKVLLPADAQDGVSDWLVAQRAQDEELRVA